MIENEELIQTVNQELAMELPVHISLQNLKEKLAVHINNLINHDFEKLVFYLYRIDVNESKMKALLQSPHENAGELIAQLIIDRQLEKLKTKQQFKKSEKGSDENEKW